MTRMMSLKSARKFLSHKGLLAFMGLLALFGSIYLVSKTGEYIIRTHIEIEAPAERIWDILVACLM